MLRTPKSDLPTSHMLEDDGLFIMADRRGLFLTG